MAGVVMDIRKRGNRVSIVLDDDTERIEVTMFDDSFAQVKHLISKHAVLIAEGQLRYDDFVNGWRLAAKRIRSVDEAIEEHARWLTIQWPAGAGPEFVRELQRLLKPFARGRETPLLEMPISWSLDDFPHFEYMRNPNGSIQAGLMNATNVLENFVDDYTYMTRVQPDFGILTYTFHPHVIGRGHRMMMLERLIQKLMEDGAEFMTMEQAMDVWLQRRNAGRKAAAE